MKRWTRIYRHVARLRTFSTTTPSDTELQHSYTMFAKVRKIGEIVFQDSLTEKMRELSVKHKIVDPVNAIYIGVCLENPLLKKYNFDPVEFMTGARMAIEEIIAAISSQDLYSYTQDPTRESTEVKFLQEVIHPSLLTSILQLSTNFSSVGVVRVNQTEVQIVHAHLDSLVTRIAGDPKTDANVPYGSSSDDMEEMAEKDPAEKPAEGFEYPAGSVVARVAINFRAEVKVVFSNNEDKVKFQKALSSGRIEFEGCISGQKDLEWKISRFKPNI